jgi:hypothetical protein
MTTASMVHATTLTPPGSDSPYSHERPHDAQLLDALLGFLVSDVGLHSLPGGIRLVIPCMDIHRLSSNWCFDCKITL